MSVLKFWFDNARPKALPQSVMPAILAFCMAINSPDFSITLGIFAVFGVIFGHLGINLFDDYFDYKVKKTSYRDEMAHQGMRARISKCSYLTSGKANMKQLLIACIIFSLLALACGTIIFLERGAVVLYFAIATAILGISYSGSPLKLSYRGLGELQIGLMFGPMSMMGVYYAACGAFSLPVLLISIPVGLLVTNIVYAHSIMDYEPDRQIGKMTFAVLLGNKRLMLAALLALLLITFGIIAAGVALGYFSKYYLLVFLTLPMAISLFYLMIEFVKNPRRSFVPRFWMGPMENWSKLQAAGIDWFMIRWLLARNLLSFFCLIAIFINLF